MSCFLHKYGMVGRYFSSEVHCGLLRYTDSISQKWNFSPLIFFYQTICNPWLYLWFKRNGLKSFRLVKWYDNLILFVHSSLPAFDPHWIRPVSNFDTYKSGFKLIKAHSLEKTQYCHQDHGNGLLYRIFQNVTPFKRINSHWWLTWLCPL